MTVAHLGLIAAFAAGVVSFLSPCLLPLVPGYLSYIPATTVRDVQGQTGATLAQDDVLLLVYALGLEMRFLLVGLLIDRAGPVVRCITRYIGPISVVAGAILVLTGLLIVSGRLAQLATYAPLFNV